MDANRDLLAFVFKLLTRDGYDNIKFTSCKFYLLRWVKVILVNICGEDN